MKKTARLRVDQVMLNVRRIELNIAVACVMEGRHVVAIVVLNGALV